MSFIGIYCSFFSSIGLAFKLPSLGGLLEKDKKKESTAAKETAKVLSQETTGEYSARMIDTIKSFMDQGYYTEASFLLSDLSKTTTEGEVAELQNKLNGLYSPEKENSFYNTDVLVPVKDFTGKYGYIDNTGNFVIPAKFDKADNFYEGMALVEIDKKQVFINRKSEIIIQLTAPEQTEIEIRSGFNSGLALCYRNIYADDYSKKGYFYIDHTGKEVLFFADSFSTQTSYKCWPFSEGFARVINTKKGDLVGYINIKGKWLVEPTFDDAFDFRDGMVIVRYPNTNKFGYIDTTGKPVIWPFADGWADDFLGGVAWAYTKDGFHGQIDKSGNRIFDTKGIGIEKVPSYLFKYNDRTDGLTALLLMRANGGDEPDRDAVIFLDKNNKRVIVRIENNDYERSDKGVLGDKDVVGSQRVRSFSNGRAFIKTKYDGWTMIDMKGNYIINPQTDWMPDGLFSNGLAQIRFRDKNIGYINRDGKIVFKE